MEVFSVFATLSLVDMISGPLGRVRQTLSNVEGGVSSLGQRMGNLALGMAPVTLAAGAMLGALGACVGVAAGFEDQMAKVGAVSRASSEEMAALEAAARELGATTQFTAVQVGEAEQYLAMAGFSAKENVAALPGVLNLAAATATDLGRAADISSDILSAFGMKAEEMSRVADVLALTCATANTNMELLGDTMKYVAPVARMAGLSLEETAAMAGLLDNVGIKGSQAGTALKAMLNKMAAPTKEAQALFEKLGVTVRDSAGNLRSPVAVLGELAAGLRNMGTAEQIAAMKMIVGEEAIAGFSELIEKEGIGAIADYAKELEAGGGSAAEMAARMNDTLAGSLRSLGSAWESVQITLGKLFLPAVRAVADGMTGFLRILDKAAQNPFGAALGKMLGVVLMGVLAAKSALLLWRGAVLAVSAVTKAWTAAQWLLNAAMTANPIGLAVAAAVALAAAAGMIIAHWDEIAAWWKGLWSGMAAGAGEAWDAITGTMTAAWESIASGIAGFGASILSSLQGAWDTASGAASAAWEGIKGIVSAAWDAIVSGIAGFGASLLAGITEAWDAVLEFFGGLNLFESGARLLSTFVDGIKSMASSVVDSVVSVFARVREYLPFSDAHVGPLSQLTLSGARMMTTLGEGVTSAQDGLVSRVSGALAAAGGAISGWWDGQAVGAQDVSSALPDLLPDHLPDLQAVPEPQAPEIAVPPAPAGGSADTAGGAPASGGQTVTITIQSMNVAAQDAASFVESLRQALQNELAVMGA